MQVKYHSDITKRILFYWSRLYTRKLSKGDNYNKLEKTIVILITQFDFVKFQKIKKFHTEWKIRETNCSNIVLTPELEFHIIELRKLNKMLDSKHLSERQRRLRLWTKFLLNPDEMEENEMKTTVDKDIQLAVKELNRLRQNQDEIEALEMHLLALMDQKNCERYAYRTGKKQGKRDGRIEGKIEGKIEGRVEGKIEGKIEGKRESQIEIAKKLIAENFTIEKISEITGLSQKEIENIN